MKSRYRWIVSAVLLALIGAGGLLFKPAAKVKANANAPTRTVLTVTVATPAKATLPRNVASSGVIAAWQEAIIGAQTGGLRIAAIHADVGTRVKAGDLLAELASDSTAAQLRSLEANLRARPLSLLYR